MKNPYRRWQEYQPSKAQALWIALGSVLATLIVGFGLGGWVTDGSAQQRADQAAKASYQQLAAAVCRESFLRATDAHERLAKLRKTQSWERYRLIASGGWATMPGEDGVDNDVAGLCATDLVDNAQSSAHATPVGGAAGAR